MGSASLTAFPASRVQAASPEVDMVGREGSRGLEAIAELAPTSQSCFWGLSRVHHSSAGFRGSL